MSFDVSTMSAADLANFAKAIADAKKSMKEADAERVAELARPLVEDMLLTCEIETSATSGWHGIKSHGTPIVIDGIAYTFSGTLTETVRTEQAKANMAAAKAKADEDAKLADAIAMLALAEAAQAASA